MENLDEIIQYGRRSRRRSLHVVLPRSMLTVTAREGSKVLLVQDIPRFDEIVLGSQRQGEGDFVQVVPHEAAGRCRTRRSCGLMLFSRSQTYEVVLSEQNGQSQEKKTHDHSSR